MFGYVLANRQALSEAELARYRGCYCGLCHAIGRAYGQPQRFALSYDLTFLVLLLSSLSEPPETQAQRRCLAHPLRRHGQWQSEFTGYAAAMNVALAYYQRLDDWTDDHAPLAWAESRMFQGSIPAIEAAYPRQLQAITDALDKLRTLELLDVQEPGQPAAAFGALMAALLFPPAGPVDAAAAADGRGAGAVYLPAGCSGGSARGSAQKPVQSPAQPRRGRTHAGDPAPGASDSHG